MLFPVQIFFSFAFTYFIIKTKQMKTKSESGLKKKVSNHLLERQDSYLSKRDSSHERVEEL